MLKKIIILSLILFLGANIFVGFQLFSFVSTDESFEKYYEKAEIVEYRKIAGDKDKNYVLFMWKIEISSSLHSYSLFCYVPAEMNSLRYRILESGHYQIYVRFFINKKTYECIYKRVFWVLSLKKIELPVIEKEKKEENKKSKELEITQYKDSQCQ